MHRIRGPEQLELVSLPRTYDPTGGQLTVEMAPSLAAAAFSALDVLEYYPYECTEQTLSRFLPNLEAYRAFEAEPDFARAASIHETAEQGYSLSIPLYVKRVVNGADDGDDRSLPELWSEWEGNGRVFWQ